MRHKFFEFFKDIDGTLSFKRLCAAIFTILFVLDFFTDLFMGVSVRDSVLVILEQLLLGTILGITAEKFSRSRHRQRTGEIEEPPEVMLEEEEQEKPTNVKNSGNNRNLRKT